MSPTPSPCINLCRIASAGPTAGLCQGCYRNLAEITAWSRASESERQAILASVARRRNAHAPQERPVRDACVQD